MTKIISLLRHAKSSWDDIVPKDFDRPLNGKGKKAAQIMGTWMAREKITFDKIIASPAIRVIETVDGVEAGYGQKLNPMWERKIYLASSATLMDVIRESGGDADHVLMIGHNPSMEDLALNLVSESERDNAETSLMLDELYQKYPTGTFAQIELEIDDWESIGSNPGRLLHFKRPRDLDPALGPDEH